MTGTMETIATFIQTNLINQVTETFAALPDARSGDGVYQKYSMSDAALSAFSVFFMQCPSFLDYQAGFDLQEPFFAETGEKGMMAATATTSCKAVSTTTPICSVRRGLRAGYTNCRVRCK